MRIGHLKLFALVIALEAVILAFAVALELRSGSHTPFQTSVSVTSESPSGSTSVPVSYTSGTAGTTTAVLSVRGGQAVATARVRSTGSAGYRRVRPG